MKKLLLAKEALEAIQKGQKKLSKNDLSKIVNQSTDISKKIAAPGPLLRFFEDCKLLISIIKDYTTNTYKEIPWWAISAIGFALLYVINPADLIPDYLPIIGFVDDATVIAVCLTLVEKELLVYKAWKNKNTLKPN